MALTATGLGSGLDIPNLVEQLVQAERLPTSNRLNLKEVRTNSELSALGQFKSALTSFQDSLDNLGELAQFQQRLTTVGDDSLIGATADENAVPGRYSVEVNSLAQRNKLASGPFSGSDAVVGNGTLSISVAGVTADIVVTPDASTLADVRDAINSAPDNPGVTATIVTGVDGARLIVSSAETGADQGITISAAGGDGGLNQLIYDPAAPSNPVTQLQAAADAQITIDGFAVTSAGNEVTGAIEGVTISLIEASPGTSIDLSVELDEAAAKASVGAFVNAYNGVIDVVSQVTSFDSESGVAGALLGDSLVRGVKDSLRRVVGNAFEIDGNPFRTLTDIGISTESDGKLSLDETKLSDAILENFDAVGELFAAEDAVVDSLEVQLESVLSATGSLELRETRLQDDLDFIEEQRATLDERMERVRERLTDQFNAMDRLLAGLTNTSNFLAQELGQN